VEGIKCELYNDNFQNYKRYGIPKAQLVIADIPYNIGNNFYGSNPNWYVGGDNSNGESKFAGKAAFNTDFNFNIAEYFHFCNRLLKKEPRKGGERGKSSDAPCMIVFCSWEQQHSVMKYAEKHGFVHCIPLVFIKNYSPQALKANMRIVGATEYALLLYRSYLPKFRNEKWIDTKGVEHGKMVFNWFEYEKDGKDIPKLHPTQKPVKLLKTLIKTFTDEGDVVIDPVAGSGGTLRAALELNRHSYGFEVGKAQYNKVIESDMLKPPAQISLFSMGL
jgi:site-specific DNA-methyltransferase (adenine-specific)